MRPHLHKKKAMLILCLTILIGACSPLTIDPIETKTAGWLDWDGEGGWSGLSRGSAEGGMVMSVESEKLMEAPMGEPLPPTDDTDWSSEEPHDGDVSQRPNLRAGSVDDNAEWDDYLLYRLRYAEWNILVHEIDVTERHIIQITNRQGQPVLGAKVTISDDAGQELGSMYTHADGKVLFFPLASGSPDAQLYQIHIEKGSATANYSLNRNERDHVVVLNAHSANNPVRLDVHFLIDATGSMSDEIGQLKTNMITISERIHALPSRPDVRFGMTIYRDRGDLFVSRTFEFTPDIENFTEELRNIAAEGGGETGGFCFVATAAFGAYDDPAVRVLRRFRDQVLLPTALGRGLVELYYASSPPLAAWIAQSPWRRLAARVLDEFRRLSQPSDAQEGMEELTPGEMDVLLLVAQGADNKTVAERLALAECLMPWLSRGRVDLLMMRLRFSVTPCPVSGDRG